MQAGSASPPQAIERYDHLGAGPATPLIGRSRQVAALRTVLGGSRTTPAVVAIVGDPGIGKTRLLAELMAQARRDGRTVFAGRATEFEREVPFGVLRNALEDHLRGLSHLWRAGLDVADQRLLPNVFPTMAANGVGPGSALLAGERYRLHRAVRALLESIAGPTGLVLALDDLHWSDESSVELLDHLLRHPPRAPVLLAMTYRPRQASARLDHAVSGAVQRGLATVINVGPLSAAEAADLLPAGLSAPRQQELHRLSGGNPFYLEVLARSAGTGDLAIDADPTGTVPPPVRAALASEFMTLDAHCQRALHAAGVAEDEFDAGLLAAVAELTEPDILVALDELVRRDVIRVTEAAGRFRFRHPLLRNAAYHHAGAGWRLAAHARAAAELGRRQAAMDVRARHIEASAVVGDMAAVELLRAAAADAMHATPAAAAHWLGSALRLLPLDPAHTDLRLQLLNLQGRALGVIGRLGQSRDILGEILRLLPAGTEERITAVSFLAFIQNLLANHAEAHALLLRELAALPDQHGIAAGTLRVGLAVTSSVYGAADPGAVVAAIELARGIGRPSLVAFALAVGVVANHTPEVSNAASAAWLDEAVQLVDAMTDGEVAPQLDIVMFVGWGEVYLERYAPARRHVERAIQVARASGQSHLIGALQNLLAVIGCATGQLPWALTQLDDSLESAVLTGSVRSRPRLLGYKSWVSVWRGELDEAVAFGEEAVAEAATESWDWQTGQATVMCGYAHYAAGDPGAGLAMMTRAWHAAGQVAARPVWQARWYAWLAAAAAANGDLDGAEQWAAHARELPAVNALPRRAAFIHMTQVQATLQREPKAAADHASRAAALFEGVGDRLGAAEAHLYAGVAFRTLGATAAAERQIATARRDFATCGASPGWLTALTGVPLTGAVLPAPPVSELAGAVLAGHQLTPRELSVLHLLAESHTAAAIARRLGISPGTVNKHLARLYRKLGTADRLSTVLLARETGLLRTTTG